MFSVDGSALDYVPLTLRKFSDVFLFLHHLKILLSLENQLPNFPLHSSIRISIPHHSKLYLSELPALILKSVLWTELLHLIHQLAIMWFEWPVLLIGASLKTAYLLNNYQSYRISLRHGSKGRLESTRFYEVKPLLLPSLIGNVFKQLRRQRSRVPPKSKKSTTPRLRPPNPLLLQLISSLKTLIARTISIVRLL